LAAGRSAGLHVKAEASGDVLTYRRFHAGRWITVALNFSAEPRVFALRPGAHEVLISTHLEVPRNSRDPSLRFVPTKAW
jgi:hypothetical protein